MSFYKLTQIASRRTSVSLNGFASDHSHTHFPGFSISISLILSISVKTNNRLGSINKIYVYYTYVYRERGKERKSRENCGWTLLLKSYYNNLQPKSIRNQSSKSYLGFSSFFHFRIPSFRFKCLPFSTEWLCSLRREENREKFQTQLVQMKHFRTLESTQQ